MAAEAGLRLETPATRWAAEMEPPAPLNSSLPSPRATVKASAFCTRTSAFLSPDNSKKWSVPSVPIVKSSVPELVP